MSKIGKKPIQIPSGVDVQIKDNAITVKGPKGTLTFKAHKNVTVKMADKNIIVERKDDERLSRGLHGLTRTLIDNMVTGVTQGFSKKLDIQGVGYRAQMVGKNLQLAVGYSHPVDFPAPAGITFEIDKEKKNIITVSGIDKIVVGQVASNLRAVRPPEPYKGKGIRYLGEAVRRKAGKAAATAAKGSA